MRTLHWWTGEELEYIRRNWEVMSDRELADHFKVTVVGFVQVRRRLGLKRPMNSAGLQPPIHWNAHKKQQPYWTRDHKGKVLNIVVYETGKPRRIMRYARFWWMQLNGPVPEGKVIAAVNGDINDVRPGNIVCVTRAEVGQMMQRRRPKSLRQAIRAKQIETLRKRRKVAAYLDFKPYQFAA